MHVYNGWCCNVKSSRLHYWKHWSSISRVCVCPCPLAEMLKDGKNLFPIVSSLPACYEKYVLISLHWSCIEIIGRAGNLRKRRYFMPKAFPWLQQGTVLHIGSTSECMLTSVHLSFSITIFFFFNTAQLFIRIFNCSHLEWFVLSENIFENL